jgi:hypothetical protein
MLKFHATFPMAQKTCESRSPSHLYEYLVFGTRHLARRFWLCVVHIFPSHASWKKLLLYTVIVVMTKRYRKKALWQGIDLQLQRSSTVYLLLSFDLIKGLFAQLS